MSDFANHGIEVPPGVSGEVRAVCPQCLKAASKKKHNLAVNATEGVWFCHRCGWKGSTKGSDRGWLNPAEIAARAAEREREEIAKVPYQRRHLNEDWRGAVPLDHPAAGPVLRYLNQRLGGRKLDPWPESLRCHLNLPYYDIAEGGRKVDEYPAMIAMVTGPNGVPVTLHRTYIAANGSGKADVPSPKKLMSVPFPKTVTGAAIRIYEPRPRLAVAEGIETALSVYVATQVPVWACLCAHGLETVVIPDTVREVSIYADNDENGKGQEVGQKLRQRLIADGRKVFLFIPPTPGADWNDELLR